MSIMTNKQRMLAILKGRPFDRIPFFQYQDMGAPDEDIWAELGRDAMGIMEWIGVHKTYSPNCRWHQEEVPTNNRRMVRTSLSTPAGVLYREQVQAEKGWSTTKHFIKEHEDYKVLLAYLTDTEVLPDTQKVVDTWKRLGDDGIPHVSLPRTPYQQLWIEWVRLEDLASHLYDFPELMSEVFNAMESLQVKVFEAAVDAARQLSATQYEIPYLVFPDNITAPIISPPFFRHHCTRAYGILRDMLDMAGVDTPISVHMDGDLKPLWDDIGQSAVRIIDSLSPLPDNDTSVGDAVRLWPQMHLGVNFPSSIHLATKEDIYQTANEILEQGGHTGQLWIQISEDLPTHCWRKSYPQIVRALRDFQA